jgi:hypothetical protein
LRSFVKRALELAAPQFWTDPCSSTGLHHPPEDQQRGGIIIHTRKAVQVALSLLRFLNRDGSGPDSHYGPKDTQDLRDNIIAAVVLHDLYKNGDPWSKNTVPQHGLIAAERLERLAKEEFDYDDEDPRFDNWPEIFSLIRDHMGRWAQPKPDPMLAISMPTDDEIAPRLIVEAADYMASRKFLSFVANEISLDD